jgi:hypothetical protein
VRYQLLIDVMDMWIPATGLGIVNFNDGVIGMLGYELYQRDTAHLTPFSELSHLSWHSGANGTRFKWVDRHKFFYMYTTIFKTRSSQPDHQDVCFDYVNL